MVVPDGDRPLLRGRSLLFVDEFCRATGLDRTTVEALLRAGDVDGALDRDGRFTGLFDDALPTREQLRARGLSVRGDYDPEDYRSYEATDEDTDDEPDDDHGGGPTWTMSWPDGGA